MTIQITTRVRCTDTAMNMLRRLYTVFERGQRSEMISNLTPIRCFWAGISPYENGTLPLFATVLAY